jgi:hypothetical protein
MYQVLGSALRERERERERGEGGGVARQRSKTEIELRMDSVKQTNSFLLLQFY